MTEGVKQMLPGRQSPLWSDWRWQWRARITDLEGLRETLGEGPGTAGFDPQLQEQAFRFAVTPYYLSLADREDPHCPILRQVIPTAAERTDHDFTLPDPLAEERHMPVPGLTHRYPDRVLWYVSPHCAVYCRFCMRKRKVSQQESLPRPEHRRQALDYIRTHADIQEVILSGGDPLSISDTLLAQLLSELRTIPHLNSIRLHTRMPVTLPQRFTPRLLEVLRAAYPLTLVTHFNHVRELTPEAYAAVRALRMNGIMVLNQAVLLRGVNDSVESQGELHRGLIRCGIKPYYLHQCDEVRGVSHFRANVGRGLEIMQELRGRNPGISLPTYVVDLPGGGGKVPLEGPYLRPTSEGSPLRRKVWNWAGKPFEILADRPDD